MDRLIGGGRELLENLKADEKLVANASAKQGLEDMSLLFDYIDVLDASAHVSPQSHPSLTLPRSRSISPSPEA